MTRVIAIFPWGDVIEDFLEPIGLTVRDFAEEMTGGWLFGYIAALKHAGWSPIIIAPSTSVQTVTRRTHTASATPIWLVPGRSCQDRGSANLRALCQWARTPTDAFEKILKEERCGALMVQEYEYPRFDALVRLAARQAIAVYGTFQGGDRTQSAVEKIVRRRSVRECAGLVVASSTERRRVQAAYGLTSRRVAGVPNPLDCAEWRAEARQDARKTLGIPDDLFLAVNHGRIDIYRKGLDVLLAAWSGPGELVLIGAGQDSKRFAAMVAGHQNVRWIDTYTNDRPLIRRWLSAADVYVMASRVEGMPVAPLEAMACGLPVIATDAHGMSDILGTDGNAGGILVPRDDPVRLAAALNLVRDDPELRRALGRRARQHVEQNYSIEVVGQALGRFLSAQS